MTSRLQKIINDFRQRLFQHEKDAESLLSLSHTETINHIQPQLDRLYKQIGEKQKNGEKVPLEWLYEEKRLVIIKDLISHNIGTYASQSLARVASLQYQAAQLGVKSGSELLSAATPARVTWAFGVPSSDAIHGIVGATSQGSPLADLFHGFGSEAAKSASDALIQGITLGRNPNEIADSVQQALNVSRWRAVTIARTEMLRAYRSANLLSFQKNSDVCHQWRWTCAKSTRTCIACIEQDGTLHDLDEEMGSHPCCRCVMAPVTRSWGDILGRDDIPDTRLDIQSGHEWFEGLGEDGQRAVLGDAKYMAWKDDKFSLKDTVGHSTSRDWGPSIHEKSLKDLLS